MISYQINIIIAMLLVLQTCYIFPRFRQASFQFVIKIYIIIGCIFKETQVEYPLNKHHSDGKTRSPLVVLEKGQTLMITKQPTKIHQLMQGLTNWEIIKWYPILSTFKLLKGQCYC